MSIHCIQLVARASPREQGFVLASTLWIIAILALAAAAFSSWVGDAVEGGIHLRDRLKTERAFLNLKAEILYAFATQSFSVRGLELFYMNPEEKGKTPVILDPTKLYYEEASNYLHLDGTPYSFNDKIIVRFQDVRGLMNINMASDQQIYRFLGGLSVPADQRDAMIGALRDYIDTDDLKRLLGAERHEYQRAGLEPPVNRPLATHWELRNVLGWNELEIILDERFLSSTLAVSGIAGFNPNTAPKELLSMVPGVNSEIREKILSARKLRPFTSTGDFAGRTGAAVNNLFLFYNFLPANTLRVDIEDTTSNLHWQFMLTMTARDTEKPWHYGYHLTMPIGENEKDYVGSDAKPFPLPSSFFSPRS